MDDRLKGSTAADIVKAFRAALDVTQRELAVELRVDRGLIGRIEAGREPDLPTLRRLLAPFGGRLELLATFEEPLEPLARDLRAVRERRREKSDAIRVVRNLERRRRRAQRFLSRR